MTNEAPLPQNIDAILVYLKTRLSLGTCRLLGSPIDKIRAHIAALDAENKRLREALEELARLGGSNGEYGNSIGNQIAKAAIAQTGEK